MEKQKYGLLLPNFGEHASVKKLVEGTIKAEKYGFDSVWIRDHLIFQPHGLEGADKTHVDTFTVLAGLATVTKKIELGSAVVIPLRHPLHLAHQFASLDWMSNGRAICGLGAGNFKHEFDAVGFPEGYENRTGVVRENVDILRAAWNEDVFSHDGEVFSFEDVWVRPQPVSDIPIWYGGSTPLAVSWAAEFCDGWLPGRINMPTFVKAIKKLEREAKEHGRPRPTVGAVPITSPDEDRQKALDTANVQGLLDSSNKRDKWVKPEGGKFTKVEDLDGVLLAGTPEDIVDGVEKFVQSGLNHLVFDLRMRFDDWDYCLDLLGQDVLPNCPR